MHKIKAPTPSGQSALFSLRLKDEHGYHRTRSSHTSPPTALYENTSIDAADDIARRTVLVRAGAQTSVPSESVREQRLHLDKAIDKFAHAPEKLCNKLESRAKVSGLLTDGARRSLPIAKTSPTRLIGCTQRPLQAINAR